jgi:hypothetical protein
MAVAFVRSVARSLVVVAFLTIACKKETPETPESTLASLAAGWNKIPGPHGTGCSHDSSYVFYVKPGASDKLTIYFQGGGGCWNSGTCGLIGQQTFDPAVDTTDAPGNFNGILDLANPANPIKDHSIVFVPYCTADVFLGNRTVTYSVPASDSAPARSTQVQHWGSADADSVMNWVFSHFTAPSLVFVTGSSAGAIPSPLYASRVAEHYPSARVVQLGDAAGGYRAKAITDILAGWGATSALLTNPAYRGVDSATFNLETLYIVGSRATPRVMFTQYNNSDDAIQVIFLRLLGVKDTLPAMIAGNLADIRAANPKFRSYTSPGDMHTILLRPEFYTLTVDSVAFRDWLAGLLDGGEVKDVGESLLAR